MANIIYQAGAFKIYGKPESETIDLVVVEAPLLVDEVRTPYINYDVNFDLVASSSSKNNFYIQIENITLGAEITAWSSDPLIMDVDETSLYCSWVSSGFASAFVKVAGHGTKRIDRSVTSVVDGELSQTFDVTDFQTGSLADHIRNATEALVSGLTWDQSHSNFWQSHNNDYLNPDCTLNPNFFARAYDWSGVSAFRSTTTDERFALALLSPRHAITASHTRAQIGETVVYKRRDGTYQSVSVIASDDVGGDLAVCCYDTDVTDCEFYKTLPVEFHTVYARGIAEAEGDNTYAGSSIPILRKAMHDVSEIWGSHVQVNHLSALGAINDEGGRLILNAVHGAIVTASIPTWDWGVTAIGGDSGSPSFVIINGELVYVTSQSNPIAGGYIPVYIDTINTAMNIQAGVPQGTYALTYPDLSGFTRYDV